MSMLRAAARSVGLGKVGAAGTVCHASSSAINPPNQLPSSLNAPQKDLSSVTRLSSKPLVILQNDDAEDWEYYVREEQTERPPGRLVFAPAPTAEEVEEATKDLHAALNNLSTPVGAGTSSHGSPDKPWLAAPERLSQQEDSGFLLAAKDREKVRDASFKPSSSHLGMLAAGSSVYQAFQLMRSNPQVQSAVKSLASDPAVWKAVLDNEKVQELTQSLQNMDETSSHDELLCVEGVNSEINFLLKITSKLLVGVTSILLQLMDKIIEIVNIIFESFEKSFSKDCNVVDKALASCLMLTVAVLLVVVIKRVVFK